jgi:carbamoyltransferase
MEGKVVGWFQGRIEAGPRALGARSILADPRNEAARDRVNAAIKYRELWRPFCPSMTREGAERYFDRFTEAPFMVITFRANSRAKAEIPAVVHVDGTSRPQIVDEETNPRYHNVIAEFGRLTGVPCVLNTSFNIKGEPIVCTPQDALRTYFATGLDALAIGNCLLEKFR